jgi:hypothetical protein
LLSLLALASGLAQQPATGPRIEAFKATLRFDLPSHQAAVVADLVVDAGSQAAGRELWIALADNDRLRTEVQKVQGDARFSWVAREQPNAARRVVVLRLRKEAQAGDRLPLHLEYTVTAPAAGNAELNIQPGAIHAAPTSAWWPIAMLPQMDARPRDSPRRTDLRLVVPKDFLVYAGGRLESDAEKGKVRHVDYRFDSPGPAEPFFLAAPYHRREFDASGVHIVLLSLEELPTAPGVLDEVAELAAGYRDCARRGSATAGQRDLVVAETPARLDAGAIGLGDAVLVGGEAFASASGRPRFKDLALRALRCPSAEG